MIDTIPVPTICPHCGGKVDYTSNAEIYGGQTYGNGKCYLCRGCGASVGTHKHHPTEPLGLLATPEMKMWKQSCHKYFDIVWKVGTLTRSEAYTMLAKKMGIPKSKCHFGHFDTTMLMKAHAILTQKEWWL